MRDEAMSPLRRRMIEDMTIRKFAPNIQHDDVQRVSRHRRAARCIGSNSIDQLACGAQIPIEPAAPFRPTMRGFVPWTLSDAGRPNTPRRHSSGRHPKPFTAA